MATTRYRSACQLPDSSCCLSWVDLTQLAPIRNSVHVAQGIGLGIVLGMLRVIEIGNNNVIAPPLPARDIIDAVNIAVREWTHGAPAADDVTLIVARILVPDLAANGAGKETTAPVADDPVTRDDLAPMGIRRQVITDAS